MFQSKWGANSVGMLVTAGFMLAGNAFAGDSCSNTTSEFQKIESHVLDIKLSGQLDAIGGECGTDEALSGVSGMTASFTTEERVKDCSVLPGATKTTSTGAKWNLVARKRDASTSKSYEVWKDSESGLLWGDRLDSKYSHRKAIELSDKGQVVREKACASNEGEKATAGIREKNFRLPTHEEFLQAEKNGIREVLPNMLNQFFWSSSLHPDYTFWARGFHGKDGDSSYLSRDPGGAVNGAVRCVGR